MTKPILFDFKRKIGLNQDNIYMIYNGVSIVNEYRFIGIVVCSNIFQTPTLYQSSSTCSYLISHGMFIYL